METLKLPALGGIWVISSRTEWGCNQPASEKNPRIRAGVGASSGWKRFKPWPKVTKLGIVNGSNTGSSERPEAQEAQVGPVRLPSPDVLSALRLALPSLIPETNLSGTRPLEALRNGCLIENKTIYRQAFVIRYSDVGPDKVASIETITNLFQEVALNHVLHSGVGADGFGTTKAMFECGLIWVVRRMHVQVDHFPSWGCMVEMDSWVASHNQASNGMRRDWIARDVDTGGVIARGTSQWVLMDMQTRRMARMPNKVREEITPFFHNVHAIPTEIPQKIRELDEESAQFVHYGLKPHRNDLDLNLHVNNVKYIPWILESVPELVLATFELRSITMDYRRECNQQDVVVSLTSSDDTVLLGKCDEGPTAQPVTKGCLMHTLRKADGSAIITAKTAWSPKNQR